MNTSLKCSIWCYVKRKSTQISNYSNTSESLWKESAPTEGNQTTHNLLRFKLLPRVKLKGNHIALAHFTVRMSNRLISLQHDESVAQNLQKALRFNFRAGSVDSESCAHGGNLKQELSNIGAFTACGKCSVKSDLAERCLLCQASRAQAKHMGIFSY